MSFDGHSFKEPPGHYQVIGRACLFVKHVLSSTEVTSCTSQAFSKMTIKLWEPLESHVYIVANHLTYYPPSNLFKSNHASRPFSSLKLKKK